MISSSQAPLSLQAQGYPTFAVTPCVRLVSGWQYLIILLFLHLVRACWNVETPPREREENILPSTKIGRRPVKPTTAITGGTPHKTAEEELGLAIHARAKK